MTNSHLLKVGKTSIGLIGLDQALQQASKAELATPEAISLIYQKVEQLNYIPEQAIADYKKAIGQEYQRRQSGTTAQDDQLKILVFGTGCVSCNQLEATIFDILAKMQLAADIVKIHELDEIWRHGVITPPALKINDDLVCHGKLPSPADIEQWLRERTP